MWKTFGRKVLRSIKVYLFLQTAKKKLLQRKGNCLRCGKCCKIVFKCPFLNENTSPPHCLIYKYRSKVCQLFPLNEKDLEDVDFVCGFTFQNDKDETQTLQSSKTCSIDPPANTTPS